MEDRRNTKETQLQRDLGSHASDPVPELSGDETPREGIGNQYQGNTEVHRAFNSQFQAEQSVV
jgi:hypothetical protein